MPILCATLGHELRIPLTPILFTSLDLISDRTVPEDIREKLKMIARNIELEVRLIDDLLEVTRIRLGKLGMTFEIADAHALLHSAWGIWANEITDKNLALQLDLQACEYCPPSGFRPFTTGILELAEKRREIHPAQRQSHATLNQSR
jgi:signal transduction histidine kinase